MFSELLQESGLSLDRLQNFCLVAQAGGITKAANGDPVKQSLFSRQIKELEEFFGGELIRRKGRGIVLTTTGKRLNLVAREAFASLLDFKKECRKQPLEVVIGAGESIIQWILLPRLGEIRKRIPNVQFKFLNLTNDEAINRLTEGMIDFAFVRKDVVKKTLQAKPMGLLGYSLFIPAKLHDVVAEKSGLGMIKGLPLATLEGDGSFRRDLAEAARKHNLKLNIQVECSSFTLAARAVADGIVGAVLPNIAVADFSRMDVAKLNLPFLKTFDRQMCLATNPRLIRIRPFLQQANLLLAQICRFSAEA